MENHEKIILDLCAGTGAWSEPYLQAGYDVRRITPGSKDGNDVRLYIPPANVYGILASPPCTEFAASGARWWKGKGQDALINALSIVDACIRIIYLTHPEKFWALENPVGRLRHYIGDPTLIFDPCDFGDPYTKKTLLWGEFWIPKYNQVEPVDGSKMHKMGPSPERAKLRSITPAGFATAFFEANR